MKYKWEERYSLYYHEADTGKIVASVAQTSLGEGIWWARINGDNFGEYISLNHAKRAVEKKVKEMDQELEELRVLSPKLG